MGKEELIKELERMSPEELEKGIIQYLGGTKITGKELLDELTKPPTIKGTTVKDVTLDTLRKKLDKDR